MFFLYNTVVGQNSAEHLDTIVKNYINELNSTGIDTVCIYKDYCVGCIYFSKKKEDKCDADGFYVPTYIFWLDKGQTFMTLKDNCFDYSTLKIDNDSIWQFFSAKRDIIKKEEIKMPQYIEIKNGKEETYSSSVDHSRHQDIQMIIGQNIIIDKDLDDYYFSKEIEEQKNINYEYNINSCLKKFQLLISNTIKTATQKQKLQKTRR